MEITTVVNENNNFSISELEYVRQIIENMDTFNQVEILKIINGKNPHCINENKYGIHINMTELNNEILEELNAYIKYVNIQENEIEHFEKQKEDYKSTFFSS
jgi:hypothetical protein